MFLIGFPLLVIPLAIYNMVAFLTPGVRWDSAIASIHLVSQADWTMTLGDIFMMAALIVLFIEVIKATQTTSRSLVDHGLSMLVFIVALIEFLTVTQAATSTFAMLVMYCLFDVVAGFSVTIKTARRDFTVDKLEA